MAGSAIAGGVTSFMGAETQAAGAEYSGRAQAAMYNYQAAVADLNAKLAKQDADYARAAGEVDVQKAGLAGGQEIGGARAAYAAGNIDASSGSAALVVRSEEAAIQENEEIAEANRVKTAYGFEVKSAEDTAQAGAYRSAAQTSIVAGQLGAEASILGGVASVASKFGQFGQSFGFGSGTRTASNVALGPGGLY